VRKVPLREQFHPLAKFMCRKVSRNHETIALEVLISEGENTDTMFQTTGGRRAVGPVCEALARIER